MNDFGEGLRTAWQLLATDPEIRTIILRTLAISAAATTCAVTLGIPAGYALARSRFRGRSLVLGLVNTGMGMPPVVVGLVVWLVLARGGVLGSLNLLYTPQAMVIAQFLIALPLVVGFTAASVQALPARLPELLQSLGATRTQRLWYLCREARLGLLAAVMAAFGAIISEVGAAMTVGGNLRGSTRVLTTAIVTVTGRGELGQALALGLILLLLAFMVNLILTLLQQRR
ncbi:MAG TPA: ABC transporter permease [Gemmatimonadales bacterium]